MSTRGEWLRWGAQTALLLLVAGLLIADRIERNRPPAEAKTAPVATAQNPGLPRTAPDTQPVVRCPMQADPVNQQTANLLLNALREQRQEATTLARQEATTVVLERVQTEALRLAGTVGLSDGAYRELRNILNDCHALQTMQDALAENLRNINTPGYKAVRLDFGANGRIADVTRLFTRGSAESTGIWSDVMLGDATSFLSFTLDDGTIAYTRDGTLRISSNGELRTIDGYALNPPITGLPTGATDPYVAPPGYVQYTDQNGNTQTVGRIQLFSFINPAGLNFITPAGPSSIGTGFFKATDSSGPASAGYPGDVGYGLVTSTFVEGSNVDTFEVAAEFSRLSQMLTAIQARLAMLGH